MAHVGRHAVTRGQDNEVAHDEAPGGEAVTDAAVANNGARVGDEVPEPELL